jgi:hypothetical protein
MTTFNVSSGQRTLDMGYSATFQTGETAYTYYHSP